MVSPRRFRWVVLAGLAAALLMGCVPTPQVTRPPVRLRFGDAADQAAVVDDLIETYSADHNWVSFTHDTLPIDQAIDRVRNDHLDLSLVPASPAQAAAGLWQSGFAYDAIAVIVNPANPVDTLTLAQLRDIFQGAAFDWSVYGGSGDIVPVSRESNAYVRRLFEERVMAGRAVTLNAVLKASGADVADYVAATPGAIGYALLTQVSPNVKVIGVEGVRPSSATSASQQYPLSFPLVLIARGEPQGDLRDFVKWLLNDGQLLIEARGIGRVR